VPALRRNWPVLQGVLPVRWSWVPADLLAGVTLAALAVPQAMGYAKIAGMPVVAGLYTLLLPMAAFALLGSSRHLVVAADSATAAILAAALAGMAAPGSPYYVRLAGLTALLTGGLLLAWVARLGFLGNFLSGTVLVGFLAGACASTLRPACGCTSRPSPASHGARFPWTCHSSAT
jgi:sulfate permease, SulP family